VTYSPRFIENQLAEALADRVRADDLAPNLAALLGP
jgi:hypothetical protein